MRRLTMCINNHSVTTYSCRKVIKDSTACLVTLVSSMTTAVATTNQRNSRVVAILVIRVTMVATLVSWLWLVVVKDILAMTNLPLYPLTKQIHTVTTGNPTLQVRTVKGELRMG